jgi:hypothetical protein
MCKLGVVDKLVRVERKERTHDPKLTFDENALRAAYKVIRAAFLFGQ